MPPRAKVFLLNSCLRIWNMSIPHKSGKMMFKTLALVLFISKKISCLDSESECLANFEISPNTIIKYSESEKKGAYFLNEKEIPSYEGCLRFCCESDYCNLAVWDKKVRGIGVGPRPVTDYSTVD